MTTNGSLKTSEPSKTTEKTLCRYHMHGACKDGSGCTFSHDRNVSPSMVCRYYQHGMCRYDDHCRYDHVKSRLNGVASLPDATTFAPLTSSNKSRASSTNESKLKHFDSLACQSKSEAKSLSATAVEFVPGQPYQGAGSYSAVVRCGDEETKGAAAAPDTPRLTGKERLLCPYAMRGVCNYGDDCVYVHGDICDLCSLAVLHPGDPAQRTTHIEECQAIIEKDMELSFLIAQSQSKECGICMDVVMEKEPVTERRFGILSNCTHVFCLECIRKWRKEKNFDSKAIRSCPECRVVSDFVTPSDYWVESREEKERLIDGYKIAMKKKPCQYFKKGAGECPFNEHCFYEHTYPDGRIASPKPRRRRRHNASGDLEILQRILLSDFFDERENRFMQELVELSEQFSLFPYLDLNSDSSNSDSDF